MGYRIWFVDKAEGTKFYLNSRTQAPTKIYTIKRNDSCKVRAVSKCDKYHPFICIWFRGYFGYRLLDIVPSSVNRAIRFACYYSYFCANGNRVVCI